MYKHLLLFFLFMLVAIPSAIIAQRRVGESSRIFIRPDGTIDPPSAHIQQQGEVYTLQDHIQGQIIVQKSHVKLDGNELSLEGPGSGHGLYLYNVENVSVKNLEIRGFTYGIYLDSSSGNTISECTILDNYNGVKLRSSSFNTICDTSILDNRYHGIELDRSNSSSILQSNLANNGLRGVRFFNSSNNRLVHSQVSGCSAQGVQLHLSSDVCLEGNTLNGSRFNLDVWGTKLSHFVHEIDATNTVDQKPIYYLLSQHDMIVSPDTHAEAGYLALIDCYNVTVTDLTLTNNGQGLLIAYSNNSNIINNSIAENDFGIRAESSHFNNILENRFADNEYGLWLGSSSCNVVRDNQVHYNRYGVWPYRSFNNNLSQNKIENNRYGIWFDSSFENRILDNDFQQNMFGCWFCNSSSNLLVGNSLQDNENALQLGMEPSFGNLFSRNTIKDSKVGVRLLYSSRNCFYHNNFIDNVVPAHNYPIGSENIWNSSHEGNFWSSFESEDRNSDGIADSDYLIDEGNIDKHPLMGIFTDFDDFGLAQCDVYVISNSSIDDVEHSNDTSITIHVSSKTTNQIYGFCRIRFPHSLWTISNLSIVIDNGDLQPVYVNHRLHDNTSHRWLYLAYRLPVETITLISEHPTAETAIALTAALLVITLRGKIRGRRPS